MLAPIILTLFILTSTSIILEINIKLYFFYFICFHMNRANMDHRKNQKEVKS
jgi:hypothetical protein